MSELPVKGGEKAILKGRRKERYSAKARHEFRSDI